MPPGRHKRLIRIAYPISSLRIGGAELRAMSLVECLPKDRFEVHFVSLLGEGPLDDRGRAAGAHVHHLGHGPLSFSSLPVRVLGRSGKLLEYARLARRLQFDIVDGWLYPTDVLAATLRWFTGTPVVVSGRATLLPRRAFGPLSPHIDRLVNRRVDAIVANSQAVADAYRGQAGIDPHKLHVIRNGVTPVVPVSDERRAELRRELGAGPSDLLVGSVGMLREVKRHSLLLDAFAKVAATRPEMRLAIIGEGRMRAELEGQVADLGLAGRVVLPGAVVDVRPLFDAFDIVASASRIEGMPNALLEAAAAGRPVVTTAAGGAVEVVSDGVTGIVTPVEDEAALAAALDAVAASAELRSRFGAAAREHVAAAFGMDRFVQEWCDLYEGLARDRGVTTD